MKSLSQDECWDKKMIDKHIDIIKKGVETYTLNYMWLNSVRKKVYDMQLKSSQVRKIYEQSMKLYDNYKKDKSTLMVSKTRLRILLNYNANRGVIKKELKNLLESVLCVVKDEKTVEAFKILMEAIVAYSKKG